MLYIYLVIHFYFTKVEDCLEKIKKKKLKKINNVLRKKKCVYLSWNIKSMQLSGILFIR